MPNITVTERQAPLKLDYGLLTGLIAGGVVWVWMLLIGALGDGAAPDYAVYVSGIVLGPEVLDAPGFGLKWLIGTGVHFVIWALIGIIFALSWPRIRKYGTWTPALLFMIGAYFVIEQVIGRLINADIVNAIGFTSLLIGYLLAGFTFAFRYRRA